MLLLNTVGKNVNDFVTVGRKFEYKFSKMLSDVCFDFFIVVATA